MLHFTLGLHVLLLLCLLSLFGLAVLQELAQKIKAYQARINELSEKSHDLAERGADLGPLCARKLYHTGYRETTVSELVNTLNAPLEPYISPLPSPRSPGSSLKYQYENPLKLSKSTDGHLNSLPSDLSFLANGTEGISDSLSKSLPSFDPKTSSSKAAKRDQPKHSGAGFSSSFGDDIGVSPTDSGINFSSHGSGLSDFRVSGKLPLANQIEKMEASTSVPKSYATFPSKRAHSEERESPNKYKSLKSSDIGSLESASVKTGSTDEPLVKVDHQEFKPRKYSEDQMESSELLTPEELKSLQARKTEALTPYQSKFYHIAAIDKDLGDEKPDYDREFNSLTNVVDRNVPGSDDAGKMEPEINEEPTQTKFDFKTWKTRQGSKDAKTGPLKAEHGKFGSLDSWEGKSDRSRSQVPKDTRDSSQDFMLSRGRKPYQPRSPSPLTLDSHSQGGSGHMSDGNKEKKPFSADQKSSAWDSFVKSKSGSHGALPTLSVYTGSGSPLSRFSSGDGIDTRSRSWSPHGRGENQDKKSPESKQLSKSLTTQGIRALHSKTDRQADRHKAGGGGLLQLLQPGNRDTVGG